MGGCGEERRVRGGKEEESDSHYHSGLRCLLFSTAFISSSAVFSHFGRGSVVTETRSLEPENTQAFFFFFPLSIHPSGEETGSSGGSIPGLPRSALGLQDRCCPGEGKRSSVQRAAVFSNPRIIVIVSHRQACHDFNCRSVLRGAVNRGYYDR